MTEFLIMIEVGPEVKETDVKTLCGTYKCHAKLFRNETTVYVITTGDPVNFFKLGANWPIKDKIIKAV